MVMAMNGQLYQICCITAATKKALKEETLPSFTPFLHEDRIEFQFLPEKTTLGTIVYTADDVISWYERCLEQGLQDIKMLVPTTVKNRSVLAFSNTTQCSLVCFYKEKVTYFSADWEYDPELKLWNILYLEQEWEDVPSEKPSFENNTESLEAVLIKIKELAHELESGQFALLFQESLDILSGAIDTEEARLSLRELPEANLRLFRAASKADVFGGIGSWNDEAPYKALKAGLANEYETLSSELLTQIRFAILYAINEW